MDLIKQLASGCIAMDSLQLDYSQTTCPMFIVLPKSLNDNFGEKNEQVIQLTGTWSVFYYGKWQNISLYM
jgi:hypothetical protein